MDLELTQEQWFLRQSARDFLVRQCPAALVRELYQPGSTGHAEPLWAALAELGWLGLAFPTAFGGAGGSLFDLGLFYEESGRVLLPTAFYSTMFAGLLITALGSETQQAEYLSRIVAGRMVGTVALAEPTAPSDPAFYATRAERQGKSWVLSGAKAFVQNAHLADPLIVIARTGPGVPAESLTALLVPRAAPGIEITPSQTFGKDRQSLVHFRAVKLGASAVLGGDAQIGRAWAALAAALQQATALQCMEMVGGAQQTLDMTVEYVKSRSQFGRPIGSFPAVQHHLANMATGVEGARWTTYQALWRLAAGLPAERELAIAKIWTGEAYKSTTVMAHQLWGGMGYVEETDLHLWSQRAKVTELFFGTRDFHLKKLATHVGL